MKYRIFLKFIFIAIIFGCSSTKNISQISSNIKIPKYCCLDFQTIQDQMKDYELKIPSNWCSYIGFHDVLSHSPKSLLNLKDESRENYLTVTAYVNESYKSKDIETALSAHIIELNGPSEFNPVYTSDIHEIYGKYYTVKRKTIQGGNRFINLQTIFNFKNRDYIIDYYVLEEDYETYITDVRRIIASFIIKE